MALESRRREIEDHIVLRVQSVEGVSQEGHSECGQKIRELVGTAADFGFEVIGRELGGGQEVPIPLMAHARIAARKGEDLDVLLRRYIAGNSVLRGYVIAEFTADDGSSEKELGIVLRGQDAALEQLIAAVTDEYVRETKAVSESSVQRRAILVERLLAGEFVDVSDWRYDLDGWNLGIAATGAGVSEIVKGLGQAFECQVMVVQRDASTVWAWLGSDTMLSTEEIFRACEARVPTGVALALGEPGEGTDGWRFSHRQAIAGLSVAMRRKQGQPVRYRDEILLASILQDDLHARSLHEAYMVPLERTRDKGEALRQTLRAYFKTNRNVSSTAAALGVSRPTVIKRIDTAERLLGCHPGQCGAELESALCIHELFDGVP